MKGKGGVAKAPAATKAAAKTMVGASTTAAETVVDATKTGVPNAARAAKTAAETATETAVTGLSAHAHVHARIPVATGFRPTRVRRTTGVTTMLKWTMQEDP